MASYMDPRRGEKIGEFIQSRKDLKPSRVLDIGCNNGAISIGLSKTAKTVVSGDLLNENLRKLVPRKRKNNMVMKFDALSLPVKDASFDVAILNGVLEHVPLGKEGKPDTVQSELLSGIWRALKKGGLLYFGIENRFSLKYLTGSISHNDMRFIDPLPRKLANAYSKKVKGEEFRQYTHSMWAYRRMLKGAGFKDIEFFMSIPNYQFPEKLVEIDNGREISRSVDKHVDKKLYKAGAKAMTAMRLQKLFSTNFVMMARK
ncbi:MAG: hypothetical protein DRO99_02340 [Candidatus Aenigmatarchaeota archaeon]|nr:MAG: hypothetical protein DRO99_02340 [Candidatus Aenigmarchaeota archaeon]